jgi:hypothetical protein
MRAKTSHEDQVLEPLAVYEDGVPLEPVFASREVRSGDAWALASDCLDAVRAVLDEHMAVRAQTPWARLEPVAQPPSQSERLRATFTRMIGLHPSRLGDLPNWWQRCARGRGVEVARRLVLEEPRPGRHGTWRMHGRWRSPWLVRSIPVELLLWPHLGAWTKLSLEPQTPVWCGRRYFGNGHRVLDVFTRRLISELDSTSR